MSVRTIVAGAVLGTLLVGVGSASARSSYNATSAPTPASVTSVTLQSGGAARSYRLFTPAGLPVGPRPVLVALHGEGGTPDSFAAATALDAGAAASGAFVVYPAGLSGDWQPQDVSFLNDVLADLAKRKSVDATRVAVVGYSDGGNLAYQFACDSAAASMIVVMAGTDTSGCTTSRPVSLLHVHGYADKVVPYGGVVTGGATTGKVGDAVLSMAARNGCGTFTLATLVDIPNVKHTSATVCPAGITTSMVTARSLPHMWTNGLQDATIFGVDMTAMTWSSVRSNWARNTASLGVPALTATPLPIAAPAFASTTVSLGDPCLVRALRTVRVTDASQLQAALTNALPGDTINVAAGTYVGRFTAATSGTPTSRIRLCGAAGVVLDGASYATGGTLTLKGSYWDVRRLTVTNGMTGVLLDRAQHVDLGQLTVHTTGQEGVHFKSGSSDNRIGDSVVRDTGQSVREYGEGIYVGTAKGNWCAASACGPDMSDRNLIERNRILRTGSEGIDVKEGTTGGQLVGNDVNGIGSMGDAMVDIKGNDWTIRGNKGFVAAQDGFRNDEMVVGWALRNVFTGNSVDVHGSGYGYSLLPTNVLRCDNTAVNVSRGLSNIACS